MEIAAMIASQAAQGLRLRYTGFARDLQVQARLVVSQEEGSKRPVDALLASIHRVFELVQLFNETSDRGQIVSAVLEVKRCTSDLRALDRHLAGIAHRLMASADGFIGVLKEAPSKHVVTNAEEPMQVNSKRLDVLNEMDELSALLRCLGDEENGGLVERQGVITTANLLRQELAGSMTQDVDAMTVVSRIRELQQDVAALSNLRSRVTGETHMTRAMPAIDRQISKIVNMLDRELAAPTRLLIPLQGKRALTKRSQPEVGYAESTP